MEIIRIKPIFKQMLWGGEKIKKDFNYPIDFSSVGECWTVSAHENGDCLVANGKYKGMKLSQLYQEHKELFGNLSSRVFPLLTKIIDAKADLSIQVHPTNEYAKIHENGALGKVECWYVIDTEPNTNIVIGHHAKTKDELINMIRMGNWRDLIREIPVKKGDFFIIDPGTIHSIKAGTMIYEIQQNSDITYRLYDYDRLENGRLRPLHIDKALDNIIVPYIDVIPKHDKTITVNNNLKEYMTCDYFTVWELIIHEKEEIMQDQACMLCFVLEGTGSIDNEEITKGDSFILPYGYGQAHFEGNLKIIISSPKSN